MLTRLENFVWAKKVRIEFYRDQWGKNIRVGYSKKNGEFVSHSVQYGSRGSHTFESAVRECLEELFDMDGG